MCGLFVSVCLCLFVCLFVCVCVGLFLPVSLFVFVCLCFFVCVFVSSLSHTLSTHLKESLCFLGDVLMKLPIAGRSIPF